MGNDRRTERKPPTKPYPCDLCDCEYLIKSSLARHRRTAHKQKISHQCAERTANFIRLSSYMEPHVQRIHTDVGQYECQVCRMTFRKENVMKSHQAIHTLKRRIGCTECGKLYREKRQLRAHMEAHTGVNMHRCNECGTSFVKPFYLQNHVHQHVNPKRFACPDCRTGFYLREFLRLRLQCDWSQVEDMCVVCGRKYIGEARDDGPLASNNTILGWSPSSSGGGDADTMSVSNSENSGGGDDVNDTTSVFSPENCGEGGSGCKRRKVAV